MTYPEFQPVEWVSLVMSVLVFVFWWAHRRDINDVADSGRLGLGLAAFLCAALCTNLEAVCMPRLFNILEHAGYCVTSVALAAFVVRTAFRSNRRVPEPNKRTSR